MSLQPPVRNWQTKPFGKDERIWVYLILFMILMMGMVTVTWLFTGDQNAPDTYTKYDSTEELQADFRAKNLEALIAGDIRITTMTLDNGQVIDAVEVLRGDVYLTAQQWDWYVEINFVRYNGIILHENTEYNLHIGSIDKLHGFQLIGGDFIISLQIVPQYDYTADITPNSQGLFRIICNEYCGVGHHGMDAYLEVIA